MQIKSIKKITIIGVGFMGGSLALDLRKKMPTVLLCGFARSHKSLRKLKRLKLLHKVERDIQKAVSRADLILLALPVKAIVEQLKKIGSFLKKGAVVVDLGSTKVLIGKTANKYLPKHVKFVACHPLCGSEKSGAEFGRQGLYSNSICVITSNKNKPEVKAVKKFWEFLGAKVVFLSPRRHDQILSLVSHLPHAVSFALTNCLKKDFIKLSSGSLRDLTRISGSPAAVWTDIFLSNSVNLARDVDKFTGSLQKLKGMIKRNDILGLTHLIEQANSKQKFIVTKDNKETKVKP
ncbi:MAG: prephenate dehydrogenase [Candidatus Omnitrophota bacterium]